MFIGRLFQKFYFELIKSMMDDSEINVYTQFIGIVRRPNLEPDVLGLFTSILTLTNPKIIERYGKQPNTRLLQSNSLFV